MDRVVELRIVEHDLRRFAAELQRDALQIRGRGSGDALAARPPIR